jgi:hypothetical protein
MASLYATIPKYLYVIRGGPNLCKVGWSINLERRLPTATWVRFNKGGKLQPIQTPERPNFVWRRRFRPQSARAIERCVKHLLQNYHYIGEWFHVTPEQAITAIEQVLKKPVRRLIAADDFIRNTDPWKNETNNK